jgi:hypothetical protein
MSVRDLNLVAVTPGGDITEDMLAGAYAFFSIREELIPLTRVRKAFKDAGLDVDRLPEQRRADHVAQEACRKIERVVQNGHREEIRVEQVDRTKAFLIYQVTRHVQDKENRVVEHPKAMRVIFDLSTLAFEFDPLEGAKMADVQPLADEILANYEKNATKMPGHKLRTIVRHYIEAAGGEMMSRSGGVYFMARLNPITSSNKLHAHHGDSIDGFAFLEQMTAAMTAVYGADADFHTVPCVNDEGQRAYLKRKFLENCSDDLKGFRDECMDLVAEKDKRVRSFRGDLRDRLIDQRASMDARRVKFAEILGETLEELDRDMTLADSALSKFLTEAGF